MRIGLVGDRSHSVAAHGRIGPALAAAAHPHRVTVEPVWLATDAIRPEFDAHAFDGIWCMPGSPYASFVGALTAIRSAREQGVPFVGT